MLPGINVTDQGYKYLGSYIGSEAGQAQYVNTLVNEWIEDVNALAKIAKTEPQLPTLHMYTGCQRDGSLSVELPQMSTSR